MMVALLLLILLYENEFEPVYENKDEIETYFKKIGQIKGQLISKCLFGVSTFFQKTNENKSTSSEVEFVRSFLEETSAWKNHFEFLWPLAYLNFIFEFQNSFSASQNGRLCPDA